MSATSSTVQQAKTWLGKGGFHQQWDHVALLAHLERLAEVFIRTDSQQHWAMMAEFHNLAGRLPYFQDWDIGALILEATADALPDRDLRQFLYSQALLRAGWCAQGATAGAEGLARARHVQELNDKMQNRV